MDVALLLILPVIGGHFFASYWNFTKFRCAREDGHRLYFRAALFGTFFFVAAYLLRNFLLQSSGIYNEFESLEIKLLEPLLKKPDVTSVTTNPSVIVITAIYALVLGLVSWIPLNLFFWEGPSLRRAVKYSDFERLIHTALKRGMPLSVTIESQKVYVGFVVMTTNPGLARKSLGILPLVSGYRSNDGRIKFNTFYIDIYETIENDPTEHLSHLSKDDFEIVLPVEKIQSANMFDFVAYEEFKRNQREVNRKKRRRKKK